MKIENKTKIDSFRFEIELSEVHLLDSRLNKNLHIVDAESGEIIEENFKEKAFAYKKDSVETYYLIRKRYSFKHKTIVEYLQILINSKILKDRYFEGITIDNYKYVIEQINNQGVIKISIEAFERATITDFDFCKDFYLNDKLFKEMLEKTLLLALKKANVPYKKFFRSKMNFGLQLSDRTAQDYNKFPFIKWYSKLNELKTRSKDFYNTYLKEIYEYEGAKHLKQFSTLRRVEVTIKNRKHLKKYFDVKNTVINVLKLEGEKIIKDFIQHYIEIQTKIIFKGKIEGKDKIIQLLLLELLKEGRHIEDITDYVKSNFEAGTKRMRAKDTIEKLHSSTSQEEIKELERTKEQFIDLLLGYNN